MAESDKEKLLDEYIKRLQGIFWPLKLLGLGRFEISRGRIVQKSLSSIFISMLILILITFCTISVIYIIYIKTNYLVITEVVIVIDFLVLHYCVMCNMSFMNRRSASLFINTSIEIDVFLGMKETKFMRDVSIHTYFIICTLVGFIDIIISFVLLFTYDVPFTVVIIGAVLFTTLYFIYYDLAFLLYLYTFLTLRVRYLNVAIMKLANIKLEYLAAQFPFNPIFWNKKNDDMVDFHKRAVLDNFNEAFVMLFKELRHLENCYRFTILSSLCYIIVGTFITVQNIIIGLKTPEMDKTRLLAVIGWCLLSWSFQAGISNQTDMFVGQIYQTSLICTYIQLKPTYPDEMYRMTSSIIRTLAVLDPRISIYGLFYFDTALLLRISSSIFVYVIMQLQIAFPKNLDVTLVDNATTVAV